MALTATMRRLDVALSDSDRGVYEQLDLRAAQHPSETDRYFVTRVIARCLEHHELIAFSKAGLHDPDEPALTIRDRTGTLLSWIEVGAPTAERLHRASKASPRVVVYLFREPVSYLKELEGQKIHHRESLELRALDPKFLDALAATLGKTNKWGLTASGGQLYVDVGGQTIEGTVTSLRLGE